MIAYWTIRARLLRVPGVANVAIWGERMQMLQVQVDPERMRSQRRHARRGHGGHRRRAGRRAAAVLRRRRHRHRRVHRHARTSGWASGTCCPIVTPEDLAQVPVDVERTASTLALGDVADVVEDHQPLIGDAVINDGPGLMLIVEKLPWGNTLEVTRGVEAALEELRPGLPGIEIDTDDLPAGDLHRDVDRQPDARRCCSAACWWCWCWSPFLFEWRTALISVVAIPLSLVAAGAGALPARAPRSTR